MYFSAEDFKRLEETRRQIRKETRRCLSEILNEVKPPPVADWGQEELRGDPADKLTLEEHQKIEDVITKSSDSDESKAATFQLQHRRRSCSVESSSQQRSSPPPLEPADQVTFQLQEARCAATCELGAPPSKRHAVCKLFL